MLLIIDSNSIIYRAYHALPRLTTKNKELVNAVYGFILVLFKIFQEFQSNYIAACFDSPAKTFRHIKYKEYKATRPPTPKDLISQIPKIKEILRNFNILIFEKEGYESDDLIGTIVEKISKEKKEEIIIVSGDTDIFQLIKENVKVYFLKKGVKNTLIYNKEKIKNEYQLNPRQLIDFKALKGDASDNIPGVKGIGEKTALELLKKYESLENIYQNLEKLKPKLKNLLKEQKEKAFLSKNLVEIEKNIPLDFNLKDLQWEKYDKTKVIQCLKKLGFKSLINRLFKLEKSQKDDTMKNNKIKREIINQKTLF